MTEQHNILLTTSRPAQLKTFVHALNRYQKINVIIMESIQDTIKAVEKIMPILVIVDDQILGRAGFDIIRRLIEVNAFIQTAAISELNDQIFHERSEGLGILCKLPLVPKEDDARKLIRQLEQVTAKL